MHSEVSADTVVLRPALTDLMSVSALLHWCSQEKKRHDRAGQLTPHFCVLPLDIDRSSPRCTRRRVVRRRRPQRRARNNAPMPPPPALS
eukprot:scaffold12951_cov112-Skeletonema_menzelii.AAC.1